VIISLRPEKGLGDLQIEMWVNGCEKILQRKIFGLQKNRKRTITPEIHRCTFNPFSQYSWETRPTGCFKNIQKSKSFPH